MNRSLIASMLSLLSWSSVEAGAADTNFYVGATAGPTSGNVERSDDLLFFPDGIVAVSDELELDDGDLGWSAVIGYRFNRHLSAEVAYVDYGMVEVVETFVTTPPTVGFPETTTIRYGFRATGPSVTVLGRLPVGTRFEAFLRGGVLFSDVKIDQPQIIRDLTFGDEVWIAGIGIDWTIGERWAARLEYERTDDHELPFFYFAGDRHLERFSLGVLVRL